jgi:hypothetical protein
MANGLKPDVLERCQSDRQNGNVQGTYFSGPVGVSQAANGVGDKYSIISVSDAIVLNVEHEARVGSEVGFIDKLEVDDPAKSGSSGLRRLGDGGNTKSVAVVVLLQSHDEGDLGRETLDVLADLDIGTSEFLAGDEGGLMRCLDLIMKLFGTSEGVDEEEHVLSSATSGRHADDAKLLGIFLEDVL